MDQKELLQKHLQQVIHYKDFDPVEEAFPWEDEPALDIWIELSDAQIGFIARKCADFVTKYYVCK